jgi:hypothetical protein
MKSLESAHASPYRADPTALERFRAGRSGSSQARIVPPASDQPAVTAFGARKVRAARAVTGAVAEGNVEQSRRGEVDRAHPLSWREILPSPRRNS